MIVAGLCVLCQSVELCVRAHLGMVSRSQIAGESALAMRDHRMCTHVFDELELVSVGVSLVKLKSVL